MERQYFFNYFIFLQKIYYFLSAISRTKKHFTIDVNGRQEIVSVDRLKPAFIIIPPSSAALPSPTPTLHLLPKLLDQVVVYTFLTVSHIKVSFILVIHWWGVM